MKEPIKETFLPITPLYAFSKKLQAIGSVNLHETIALKTLDCYGNFYQENLLDDFPRCPRINPVTGPLFIEGIQAGDTLIVDIIDLKIDTIGTMNTRPGVGAYGRLIEVGEVKRIPIVDNQAILSDTLKIPLAPMIGVIGVAPADDDVPTISPGKHGGNMDTRFVTKGARLYLPVSVDGALFGLGDLHAAMGDGETAVCGMEIPGEVIVSFSVIKNKQHEWPVLENETDWMVIVSHEDLDRAAILASESMLQFLIERTSHSKNDLVRLLGLCAHLEVSQIVNPLKTVRLRLPKQVIDYLVF